VAPNLKVGSNGAAALNIAEPDLSSFTGISHNVWPAFGGGGKNAECIVNGKTSSQGDWTAFPQVSHENFADLTLDDNACPILGSPADGAGEPTAAVAFDQLDHRRSAKPTVGAIEIGENPTTQQAVHNN
jgi:hypothetical protein